MHRAGRAGDQGRTRVVALALLVVGIGLLGAILLPRLIHDGRPTGSPRASASICFVTANGGAPRGGMIRLVARRPGKGADALDLDEPVAQHQSPEAMAVFLADSATDAGWAASQAGACLYLDGIDEVGGSPGQTGTEMALGLSVESSGSASFRLRIEEGRPDTSKSGRFTPSGPVEDPARDGPVTGEGRLVLTAQPPAEAAEGAGGEPAVLVVTYDLGAGPAAVRDLVTRELGRTGWSYDVEEGTPPQVVLRRRPDGLPIGAILLTLVGALEDGPSQGEPHPLLFVVGVGAR